MGFDGFTQSAGGAKPPAKGEPYDWAGFFDRIAFWLFGVMVGGVLTMLLLIKTGELSL